MKFIYRCVKCDSQCQKPPVMGNPVKHEKCSLGTWRCPKHGPTKVSRERA